MYVPIIRKIINNNNKLIERALPEIGDINVKIGDKVEPFNQLGSCRVSYQIIKLPINFKVNKSLVDKHNISKGSYIGKINGNKIYAPFTGFLKYSYKKNEYSYNESTKDYNLLSAVWGKVTDIVNDKSILITSNFKDILMPVTYGTEFSGELVVFPNPSELLIGSFLEKFTKDVSGKIFYVGGHISLQTIKKAHELNLTTLLAGSISTSAYAFAKEKGISVGIFEGFGSLQTSQIIFDELKNISNRYVFFYPQQNLLRIPVIHKLDHKKINNSFKLLKKGDLVQVFQDPHFGIIGYVDTIEESSILVKIPKNSKLVKVYVPNFFLVV